MDCFAAVATAANGPVAVNLSRGSAHDPRFVLWNLRLNHGRFPMPIRAYLDGQKLDGETIRQVGIAFEMALASLGLRRPHS